jgi:hypothetical protein
MDTFETTIVGQTVYTPTGLLAPSSLVFPVTKTFKGTLPAGVVRSLFDLTGLRRIDTVQIQHVTGTGLIRVGGVNAPYWSESFEPPAVTTGSLYGQGSPAWNNGLASGNPQVQSTLPIMGAQSLSLNSDGVNVALNAFPIFVPPLAAVSPGAGYTATWLLNIPAAVSGAGIVIDVEMHATGGFVTWRYEVDPQTGVITVTDSPGSVLTPHVLGTTLPFGVTNTLSVVVGGVAAGDAPVTFMLNGMPIFAGAMASGFASVVESLHVLLTDPTLDATLNRFIMDQFSITTNTIAATGLGIPDGAGIEFNAVDADRLLDGTDLGLSPATGEPAADVEILCIGSA